jgi:hypothetical protein
LTGLAGIVYDGMMIIHSVVIANFFPIGMNERHARRGDCDIGGEVFCDISPRRTARIQRCEVFQIHGTVGAFESKGSICQSNSLDASANKCWCEHFGLNGSFVWGVDCESAECATDIAKILSFYLEVVRNNIVLELVIPSLNTYHGFAAALQRKSPEVGEVE